MQALDTENGARLMKLTDNALAASRIRSNPSLSMSDLKAKMGELRNDFFMGADQIATGFNFARLLVYHLSIWSLGPPFASSKASKISSTRDYVKGYANFVATYAQRGYILPWIVG